MNKFIKRILPLKIFNSIYYLRNYNHNVYKFNTSINLKNSISDLFIWSSKCTQINFIAENVRALILGKKVDVIHNFKFFSRDGILISHQKYKANSFFERISFEDFKSDGEYFSFIHFVESEVTLSQILDIKGLKNKKDFCEQNRGYTVYYPSDRDSGSIVHGNFGGVFKDEKKLAITNIKKHIYTPIYKFKKESTYDIVFNNPTDKKLIIKLILNNNLEYKKLILPSLGTRFINLKGYEGSVSFESRLAICRALIFKNPAPNSRGDFDVFHS